MTDLNDQEYAEVLRLELDRAGLRTDGHAVTDYLRMRISELDPPDPFAGLDDDQWVEVTNAPFGPIICAVETVRASPGRSVHALIRVVPDGDAREVLVIPVERVRKAVAGGFCNALLENWLHEHDQRWSS